MALDDQEIRGAIRDDYELQRVRLEGNHDTSIHLSSEGGRAQDIHETRETTDPPSNAVSDLTPTRRYQALLLLSGFTMIFWIIGLNSVYGVFQASQR